jgi:hypothetical protein
MGGTMPFGGFGGQHIFHHHFFHHHFFPFPFGFGFNQFRF